MKNKFLLIMAIMLVIFSLVIFNKSKRLKEIEKAHIPFDQIETKNSDSKNSQSKKSSKRISNFNNQDIPKLLNGKDSLNNLPKNDLSNPVIYTDYNSFIVFAENLDSDISGNSVATGNVTISLVNGLNFFSQEEVFMSRPNSSGEIDEFYVPGVLTGQTSQGTIRASNAIIKQNQNGSTGIHAEFFELKKNTK